MVFSPGCCQLPLHTLAVQVVLQAAVHNRRVKHGLDSIWLDRASFCALGRTYLWTMAPLSEPCRMFFMSCLRSSCVCFCWRTRSKAISSWLRAEMASPSRSLMASPKRAQFFRPSTACEARKYQLQCTLA